MTDRDRFIQDFVEHMLSSLTALDIYDACMHAGLGADYAETQEELTEENKPHVYAWCLECAKSKWDVEGSSYTLDRDAERARGKYLKINPELFA